MNHYALARDIAGKADPRVAYSDPRYHVFDSREGRDAWVRNDEDPSERREALPSSDSTLRRYLRDQREYMDELYWHYKDEEGG